MPVSTFDRDDVGYLGWLATHPNGYVINIGRSLTAGTARLHHASCRTIGGQPPAGRTWTGPYLKVCADAAGVLDEWALEQAGAIMTRCGTCQPSGSGLHAAASKVTSGAATTLWGANSPAPRGREAVGMIGCRVLAPGLPDRHPPIRLVVVAGSILDVEGRGTPCAAPRGLGAPANEPEASPRLGQSSAVHRVVSAPSSARATASAGHARHDPALASPSDSQEVDLPTPDRPPTHRRGDHRADRAAGPAEPELGIPTDPGRTAQARPPSRRLDDPARAHPAADTTRTDPRHRPQLAAVPPTHASTMVACDFFHVECAVTLRRIYVFFVIEIDSRYVHILGATTNPDGPWTTQQARNLLADIGDRSGRFRYLVRDRAGQFTRSFDAVLADSGINVIQIPPRCPQANWFAERFVGTVRAELTDRMLIFGQRHLRLLLHEYVRHYNTQRPHRGQQLRPPRPEHTTQEVEGPNIVRRPILGGLINEYRRAVWGLSA